MKKSFDGEEVPTKNPYFGAIDGVGDLDWQFGATAVKIPKARLTYYDTKIEYNQNKVNAYSCTVFASMGALSDLTGYKFSLDEQKDVFNRAVAEGLDPTFGWYGHKAVDLVRRWWNEKFPDRLIVSQYAMVSRAEDILTPLNLGYSMTVGLKISEAMMKDYYDGKLDSTEVSNTLFGHFVRMVRDKDDAYKLIIDNYEGKKGYSNKYTLTYIQVKDLLSKGVFFNSAYFYMYKTDYQLEQEVSNISPWALASVEKAKKVGITDWSRPKKIVAGTDAEAMLKKAGSIQEEHGGMTQERFAVFMDKNNLFPNQ